MLGLGLGIRIGFLDGAAGEISVNNGLLLANGTDFFMLADGTFYFLLAE